MRITLSSPTLLLVMALSAQPAAAQRFTGTFTVPTEGGGAMSVTLREARTGAVTGRLAGDGIDFRLDGRIEDGLVVGTATGPVGSFPFEAERLENELWVVLYGTDGQGRPNYDDYQEIGFYLAGTEPPVGSGPPGSVRPGGNPLERPGGGNPLASGGADPYVGTFTDGSVTLQLQGVAGQYQGQVTVGGQVYSVAASGGPSGLQGVIQAADGSYAMAVQSIDGGLYVVSGGQQYHLFPQTWQQGRFGQAGGFRPQGTRPGGFGAAPGRPGAFVPGGRSAPGGSLDPLGRSGVPGAGRALGGRGVVGGDRSNGFSESHPQAVEWVQLLSGAKLGRMSGYPSGGAPGYGARADVYLCSDRSFSMRDVGTVRTGGRDAFDDSGTATGPWYVVSDGLVVVLVLELRAGRSLEFRMDRRNGETYANEQRVVMTPADVCR